MNRSRWNIAQGRGGMGGRAMGSTTDRRRLREGLHVGVPGLLLDGEEDACLAVGAQQRRGEHREPARRAPQEQLRGAHPPLQRRRHAPRLAVVAHRHVAGADAVAGRRSSSLAHG
jgi:hypothetical protein